MKRISALLVTSSFYLLLAQNAFADNICPPAGSPGAALCNLNPTTVIGTGVAFIFIVAGIIALAYLIYGGIRWITSGGDKNNVETARQTIIAAVIGLVVIFLSYVILNLVLGFFNISLSNFTLPHI